MTGKMEENDMGRKKQISDQKRLHRARNDCKVLEVKL